LKSSRTTYFDSLTGITKIESGKSSEALKIKGKPEMHKTETAQATETQCYLNGALSETVNFYGERQQNIMTLKKPESARRKAGAGRSSYTKLDALRRTTVRHRVENGRSNRKTRLPFLFYMDFSN